MSKISIQPISPTELMVSLSSDTPQKMINELYDSLLSKGLVEDLSKSTATSRYFYREASNAGSLADQLISNLKKMSGLPQDLNKSNYGPKGKDQYTTADNVKRKAGNIGDKVGEGPNTNVKAYSTKPGQLSAKAQAALIEAKQRQQNKKQPVKTLADMTPEEQVAMKAKYADPVKKSWADHYPVPNADQEVLN